GNGAVAAGQPDLRSPGPAHRPVAVQVRAQPLRTPLQRSTREQARRHAGHSGRQARGSARLRRLSAGPTGGCRLHRDARRPGGAATHRPGRAGTGRRSAPRGSAYSRSAVESGRFAAATGTTPSRPAGAAAQPLAAGTPMMRVRLGDLSVGFVHSLSAALREKQLDPQPLLEAYGLDAARLAEPRARLSIPRYMRLGHAAIQLAGDPALGLEMGRLQTPPHVGLAGVTAAQAPTVREAARALIRFEPLYASNYRGSSAFEEDATGAWLRFYSISPYNAYNRFVVDTVLASWISQLSAIAAQPVRPTLVRIEFDEPD